MYASLYPSHQTAVGGDLGIAYGSDPVAFLTEVVKRNKGAWTSVCDRVSKRVGADYVAHHSETGRLTRVPLRVSSGESCPRVTAAVVACANAYPEAFVDEARRYSLGMRPGRGQDGDFLTDAADSLVSPRGADAASAVESRMGSIATQIVGIAPSVTESLVSIATGDAPARPAQKPTTETKTTSQGWGPVAVVAGVGAGLLYFLLR